MMTEPQIDSSITDTTKLFKGLADGKTYWFRVRGGNDAGWGEFSEKMTILVRITLAVKLPKEFRVFGFNPNGMGHSFKYSLPERCDVRMVIYNINGVCIKKMINTVQNPGVYSASFPNLPSGTYYIAFTAGKYRYSNKFIFTR